jgi:YHS domain-containing protein
MKVLCATAVVVALSGPSFAQPALPPEECLVPRGGTAGASATFAGKTYEFTKPECRDVFLSDPERFAQLYDALLELAEEGVPLQSSPQDASLVPS